MGLDGDFIVPDTRGTVHGRFEGENNVNEIGGYVHSSDQSDSKIEFVVAVRGDGHSRFEYVFFSPRLGLVYKPSPQYSFRATYNRTIVNPASWELFLDIVYTQNSTPL